MCRFLSFFCIEVFIICTNSAELIESLLNEEIQFLIELLSFLKYSSADSFHQNLLLALVGGEITLTTLIFTLLPLISDKRDEEYYLGIKVADYFLFEGREKKTTGKLTAIWIYAAIFVLSIIGICYLKWLTLAYIVAVAFLVYLIIEIFVFLNFISDKETVKSRIETKVANEIEHNRREIIERLVETSKDSVIGINENIKFLLSKKQGEELIEQYVDCLLEKSKNLKKETLEILTECMREREFCLHIYPDEYELFKFFRNAINDFNKEEYYDLIYLLMINNYACYTTASKKREPINYSVLFLRAIDASQLTDKEKVYFKNRIIRNISHHMYLDRELEPSNERYSYVFRYMFEILRYVIDTDDIDAYKTFTKSNKHIENSPLLIDIYTTNEIYFYYLTKIEQERYVSKEEREQYTEMRKSLKSVYSFKSLLYMEHYYIWLTNYLELLEPISRWWDRMEADQEMKSLLAPATIVSISKGFRLIFEKTYFGTDYIFNNDVVNDFKYDFKNGKLEKKVTEQISCFYEFVEYEYGEDSVENFELQYMNYVADHFKRIELDKKINYVELEEKLKKEKGSLTTSLVDLSIFNSADCDNITRLTLIDVYNKDMIENYYTKRPLINVGEAQRSVETYIFEELKQKINRQILYSRDNADAMMEVLETIEGERWFIKPKADILARKHNTRMDYERLIEGFKIIETNTVLAERLLIETYQACLREVRFELEPIDSKTIEEKKKHLRISEDVYCRNNIDGIEILYNEDEIEEYLKNTYVTLYTYIDIGLEVSGNNIVFVRQN
ncbi:MAG: hypothetical protein IKJ77_03225 [Firmicutes bacterium]|nr:hypothetical protein [Bacillota bacterium]